MALDIVGCPIQVPILDTSRVTVQGEGIRQVAVNRSSYFRVNTQSAGVADLQVRVTCELQKHFIFLKYLVCHRKITIRMLTK